MTQMWGDAPAGSGITSSDRVALFRDGNYGMFIHWGIYSHLGGQWRGQTFYGIGEWIKRQMKISEADYMALARDFNPAAFDAREIVRFAKAAGMKWIIITSKHHDGFAMFKSAHPFNIVDASPFGRDPMKELAAACREGGLGFGFYYSHNQDWTAPGGNNGPKQNADGSPASFEQYFREKCLPQVKEICTQYGPLNFVWFDTPGNMPKDHVVQLADLVRQTQPGALLCSRVGHGLGDYVSKGDMEVPPRNLEGLWETCDTTNDSWAYAWYDQNWKDTREILHRLVSTVGRGGTYLLNVGPDGQGRIPAQATKYLLQAGEWIKRYPQVVYSAGASPWDHAQPWGDVTTKGNTLNLVVFDWPAHGRLFLPGLQTDIVSAGVVSAGKLLSVAWKKHGTWTELQLPSAPPDHPASVVAVKLRAAPKVDQTLGLHPNTPTNFLLEFAEVKDATKKEIRWMEKFGEWKAANQVSEWNPGGQATWTVDVAEAGDYRLELNYKGEGRLVWRIETDEGVKLQNQQNSSPVYHTYPFGLLMFKTPGKHTVAVSLVDGPRDKASLSAVRISPVE
ncbi:MAG: alpha-L-fucosidase [Verrucomicrobia bacterium]|nr:alpha-L-fucosidase [Verrucomicrobiota bacterium]